MPNRLIISVFVLTVFFSCKKDKTATVDLGYNYFPAEIGKWIIYDVDSIAHDDFNDTVIAYKFQIKEFFESEYTDNEGRKTIRIERYKRNNDTMPWIIKDVWALNIFETRVEKVEEDIRYVKLVFPAVKGKTWNGNAFNNLGNQDYKYADADVPLTVNNIKFDSTLSVLHYDQSNLIERKYSEEKFARGVGMIYKEFIELDLQDDAGLELKMKINSWGK
jgi:hypothetical protein